MTPHNVRIHTLVMATDAYTLALQVYLERHTTWEGGDRRPPSLAELSQAAHTLVTNWRGLKHAMSACTQARAFGPTKILNPVVPDMGFTNDDIRPIPRTYDLPVYKDPPKGKAYTWAAKRALTDKLRRDKMEDI